MLMHSRKILFYKYNKLLCRGRLLLAGGSQSVVVICSTYERGGGRTGRCVVLLTEGLILAGCLYFSLYIDTTSDVGLYTLSFTLMFATVIGGV